MIIHDLAFWDDLFQEIVGGNFIAYSQSKGHAISYAYAEGWNTKTSTYVRIQVASITSVETLVPSNTLFKRPEKHVNEFWS
jgi:hypothetical protein